MNKTFYLFYVTNNNKLSYIKLNALDSTNAKHLWVNFYKLKGESFVATMTKKAYIADKSKFNNKIKQLLSHNYKYIVFYSRKITEVYNTPYEIAFVEARTAEIAKKIFMENRENISILKVKRCKTTKFEFSPNDEEPFIITGYEELKECIDYCNNQMKPFMMSTSIIGDFKIYFNNIKTIKENVDISLIS